MNNTTKLSIAALLSAAGAVLNAFAGELAGGEITQTIKQADTPVDPPTKPKKAPKTEKPAEKPADPAPETPAEEPAAEGKSYEDLRAMIEPLVKGGQGEDVKKVIAKYGANLKDIATKPETHAAFEKDLAALSY